MWSNLQNIQSGAQKSNIPIHVQEYIQQVIEMIYNIQNVTARVFRLYYLPKQIPWDVNEK